MLDPATMNDYQLSERLVAAAQDYRRAVVASGQPDEYDETWLALLHRAAARLLELTPK
jgi:predicted transcriptional regulator